MNRLDEEKKMIESMKLGTPVYFIGYPKWQSDDPNTPAVLSGTIEEIRTERGWQLFRARDEYGRPSNELTAYQFWFDKEKAIDELKGQLTSAIERFQKRLNELDDST